MKQSHAEYAFSSWLLNASQGPMWQRLTAQAGWWTWEVVDLLGGGAQ